MTMLCYILITIKGYAINKKIFLIDGSYREVNGAYKSSLIADLASKRVGKLIDEIYFKIFCAIILI